MDPVNELNAIILNGRIPNALLFTGNCGQDKKRAAMTFIKAINCLKRGLNPDCPERALPSNGIPTPISLNGSESDNLPDCRPCNSCRSCVKIDSAMHPDIITVAPEREKPIIKISQIRELCSALASKPHEAKVRMVVVEDAEAMNRESANALLKVLEEPPEQTFFILLTRDLKELLPTIISRCRHLRFRPISQSEVAKRLNHGWNIDPSVAMSAAIASNGDMDKAMMLANVKSDESTVDPAKGLPPNGTTVTNWINRRYWLLKQLCLIVKPSKNSSSLFLYALALAEKLSQEASLIQDSLSLMKLWLRDMALIRHDREHIINSDFFRPLLEAAETLPESYPITALEAIHRVEIKIKSNGSLRLILEQLFLSLIPTYHTENHILTSNNSIGTPL